MQHNQSGIERFGYAQQATRNEITQGGADYMVSKNVRLSTSSLCPLLSTQNLTA